MYIEGATDIFYIQWNHGIEARHILGPAILCPFKVVFTLDVANSVLAKKYNF